MAPRPRSAQALDSRRTRGTQSYRCRVCRGIHPLRKVQRFLKLSAEKRLRAVLINKYCANCLAHEHSTGSCRSGDRCRTCNRCSTCTNLFPGKSPAPSNSPLLRTVRTGKIRQLAKRLPLHCAQHPRHQLRRSRHFSSVLASTSSRLLW